MPWNPNNPLKRVKTELQAISINASGIVATTCSLRQIKNAWATYNGEGGSGQAIVNVVSASGSVVDVAFLKANNTLSGDTSNIACFGSGVGFSGGKLEVWAEGV